MVPATRCTHERMVVCTIAMSAGCLNSRTAIQTRSHSFSNLFLEELRRSAHVTYSDIFWQNVFPKQLHSTQLVAPECSYMWL